MRVFSSSYQSKFTHYKYIYFITKKLLPAGTSPLSRAKILKTNEFSPFSPIILYDFQFLFVISQQISKHILIFVTIGKITEGSALLGVIGIILTSVLVIKKVPGNLLIGILATTLIGIPMGITEIHGLVDVPPSVSPIFCQFDFSNVFSIDMVVIVFTFLFIDMFDTMGTLVGVCTKAGMMKPDGRIHGLNKAFMADAVATVAGACFGTSTTTTYVESASGVAQGGRTGLTAFITAMCFVVALFFAPLFLSVPSAATTPVLVIVGLYMMSPIKDIDLNDYAESIPAFITIIMMPLTYSISDGILCGMISYVAINACCGNIKKLSITMWVLAILFVLKYIFI